MLTRLGGQAMALNPDLIERAESTPDTVITMVDGHKLVVSESVDDVVRLIRRWRASVAAEAFGMSSSVPLEHRSGSAGEDEPGQIVASGGAPPLARVLRMPAREE